MNLSFKLQGFGSYLDTPFFHCNKKSLKLYIFGGTSVTVFGEQYRVDNYKRAKIVFETNPGSLPTEIQREIEQDLKKLQTEILRIQIDQVYQLMKAE